MDKRYIFIIWGTWLLVETVNRLLIQTIPHATITVPTIPSTSITDDTRVCMILWLTDILMFIMSTMLWPVFLLRKGFDDRRYALACACIGGMNMLNELMTRASPHEFKCGDDGRVLLVADGKTVFPAKLVLTWIACLWFCRDHFNEMVMFCAIIHAVSAMATNQIDVFGLLLALSVLKVLSLYVRSYKTPTTAVRDDVPPESLSKKEDDPLPFTSTDNEHIDLMESQIHNLRSLRITPSLERLFKFGNNKYS